MMLQNGGKMNLINHIISISILIVCLSVIEKALVKRYFFSCIYLLWICLLIKLCIPFSIHLGLLELPFINISATLQKNNNLAEEKKEITVKKDHTVIDNNKELKEEQIEEEEAINLQIIKKKGKNSFPIKLILVIIWGIGAALFGIYSIMTYFNYKQKVKREGKVISNPIEYDAIKKELNITKSIPIIVMTEIDSPQLFGMIKPVILLPEYNRGEELYFTLKHELIHYKHRDLIWKLIALIVNMIYWFYPFSYLLVKKINNYSELSCDETVLLNQGIEYRQKYGIAVLHQMKEKKEKERLTMYFGTNKKFFKRRFFAMMDSTKKQKGRFVMLFFFVLCFSFQMGFAKETNTKNIAAILQHNNLNIISLNNNEIIRIDSGKKIEYPILSKKNTYVAYIKRNSLYIAKADGTQSPEKICKLDTNYSEGTYTWKTDKELIYSPNKGGLYCYKVKNNQSVEILTEFEKIPELDNNNNITKLGSPKYENIISISNGVYADKLQYYYRKDQEGLFVRVCGTVKIQNYSEKIIIPEVKEYEEGDTSGYYPVIACKSLDNKYIYYFEHPHSGSVAADGVGFGVYDVEKEKAISMNKFKYNLPEGSVENVITLLNKENIGLSVKNTKKIALISGSGREPYTNKHLIYLDTSNQTFEELLPKDMAAMTPSFSIDGNYIYYAASKEDNSGGIEKWMKQAHSIYKIDKTTKEITRLTTSNSFDFFPQELSNGVFLFCRYEKEKINLYKMEDGIEIKLIQDIGADNSWVYDTRRYIMIH